MRKIRKPVSPICLCNSFIHWMFGVVSPSKIYHFMYCGEKPTNVENYFLKLKEYRRNILAEKVRNRTATRSEWKEIKKILSGPAV